jgi:hypothetical protein
MSRPKRRPPFARLRLRFTLLKTVACGLACLALASAWTHAPARAEKRRADATPALTPPKAEPSKADARAKSPYGQLPLRFEPNRGQADPAAQFVVRGAGYDVSLTAAESVIRLRGASEPLRMKVAGTEVAPGGLRGEGLEPLAGVSNYFVGSDPARWLTRVPHFARVRYASVYPGVDLEYYGNRRRLEYDFRVAAGADPSVIALGFEGARRVRVDARGDLLVSTRGGGDVRLLKPVAYQLSEDGARVEVAARYRVEGGRVRFRLGAYDARRPLVIDPCVEYATFLGGDGDDRVHAVAVDAQGNAVVTGITTSTNFPVNNTSVNGITTPGNATAFVSKVSADGTQLLFSTYYGGTTANGGPSPVDISNGVGLDAAGNVYVAGYTNSNDFPRVNAFQASKASSFIDGFVVKFDPTGSAVLYSTYLGGWRPDYIQALAVDAAGHAYVAGWSGSFVNGSNPRFPTTPGAFQTDFTGTGTGASNSAAFVAKMRPDGSGLDYCTFLGGRGINPAGALAGSNPDDIAMAVAVDAQGQAVVAGRTESDRFPVLNPVQPAYGGGISDAFVTKLNAAGTGLVYSTYLGGGGEENRFGAGAAVDPQGNAYTIGSTNSGAPAPAAPTTSFPTFNAMQPAYSGQPETEAFAVKLNTSGGYVYSTYAGRNGFRRGYGVAADAAGNAYLTGSNALRKLDAAGALVIPSHTLGGEGRFVALDPDGGVYVGGVTSTTTALRCSSPSQFCPTAGAFRQNPGTVANGNFNEGFVIKFEGEEDTVEIAGYTFPREALADDAVQTKAGIDASAQFCSRIDYAGTTVAQRVKSALTDGCPATSTLGDAEFEAAFIDNRVVNLPGEDLAVFEIGSGNGNEPFSVSVFYQGQFTAPRTYTPAPTAYFDCANLRINVARIDLSDFGLPPGAQVSRLRFDNLFVPNVTAAGAEIADIAAINSAPPNSAPAANAGPDQLIEATAPTTNVILDGSASSDPDFDALAYEWRDSSNNVVGNTATVGLQLPLGTHTFTLKVDDGKGGTASDTVTVVVQDTTAPSVNCGTSDGQWHAADAQIACTASDAASGLVNASDASFTLSTSVPNGTEDANASTNSRQVCDKAGNCSTAGPVAGNMVDKRAPSYNCGAADNAWHASDVSIPCTASDGGSGLTTPAAFTLTTSVPAGTETANASTDSQQVCDAVGHCVTAGPVGGNKVDKKAPDITITSPAQGASYAVGQPVAASYACADNGSGVTACAGTAANGGAVDTATVGPKSFTVTSTDAVGNTSSKTVTYNVGYGVCALYDQTKAHKSGSTIPVKLQLCGPGGENLSSSGITVTALGTVRLSDFAPGEVEDAGHANPDDNFRFEGDSYIFNLKTTGLTTGTYVLVFQAGADPTTHGVQFQIK